MELMLGFALAVTSDVQAECYILACKKYLDVKNTRLRPLLITMGLK